MVDSENRILIVDDEDSIRELLGEFLSEHYSEVQLACDGREAVAILEEHPVDIVMTDLVMPEISGLDLMKRVQDQNKDTVVIVMTGYASVKSAVEAMRLGAFDYLIKPFNLSESLMTLERASELIDLKREKAKLVDELTVANKELEGHRERLKEEVYQTNKLLQQRVVELSTLYEVGKSLIAELDREPLLKQIVDRVSNLLRAQKTSLMTYDTETNNLKIEVSSGLDKGMERSLAVELGSGPSGYCGLMRQPLLVEDISEDARFQKFAVPFYLGKSFLCVPLVARDELIGVLNIADKANGEVFNQSELDFVVTMTSQASIAIDNARLYENVKQAYLNAVRSLMGALEKKDLYTRGHSERVTKYCSLLADALKMPEEEKENLLTASSLHDIGKIGISEGILNKEGGLTDEEYDIIKTHPAMGEQILMPLDFLSNAVDLVRHHHEREDGRGYPDGLSSEGLTTGMRILIVADAFDAMTSKRSYRSSLPMEKVISELEKGRGTQFHAEVVDAFVSILKHRPELIVSDSVVT